jgi:hypothetical protein
VNVSHERIAIAGTGLRYPDATYPEDIREPVAVCAGEAMSVAGEEN